MRKVGVLLLLIVVCLGAAPVQAVNKTTKTVRFHQFTRGEYCLHIREIFTDVNNEKPLDHCIQDNDKAYLGVKSGVAAVCPNEKAFACMAKYGQLVAGGWPYFHGDGIAYKKLPNSHLVAGYKTSTYLTPFSRMDQPFFARSTVAGSFAYTYMRDVKLCLEVYDWGQPHNLDLYTKRTLLDYDCLMPGEAVRPLEVSGTAFAGRLMWIVVSLYSPGSDGISYFTVLEVVHDIS